MPPALDWEATPLAQRAALIRQGVPAAWLREIEISTGLSRASLCRLLGLKVSTINRRLQHRQRLSPDESERLMGMHRLIGQVQALVRDCGTDPAFDAAAWFIGWMQRPNQALGDAPPADFLDTADGRAQISALLGAMRSGSYR
jgi:putative toxin-antitoxin system antitoxin component (TIGR02293 family)